MRAQLTKVRWWVYVYTAVALAVWIAALMTDDGTIYVAAHLVSAPLGIGYQVAHRLVFSLLNFDPTVNAPEWQVVVTSSALVLGETLAAFIQAALISLVVSDAAERRSQRRRNAAPSVS